MLQIKNTIVSEDLIEKEFVCNLSACKGVCCVAGDAGAPLELSEKIILEQIYDKVKPFLNDKGVAAIEEQGLYTINDTGDVETPLVSGKECAYTIFEDGKASCGIEKAYNQGAVDWKKPISCHLYPVRIQEYSSFSAVNYNRWSICDDACSLGESLSVPVYRFVKDALLRKFGKEWYAELELFVENKSK